MSTMSKLREFVVGLFSRAEQPVPRPVQKPEPEVEAIRAQQGSSLSQPNSSALRGRDYDVDSRWIRWHRL
jgi:hypothetical protein